MSTIYLRNVPDDVADGIARLAAREGMSVNAFAVRALSEIAARAGRVALLGDLPDVGVASATIVETLDEQRSDC